jgi:hypothetical protein
MTVNNGHGTPRDNFYQHKADCDPDEVVVFDRHSLDGLDYEDGGDWLHVFGNPKPARKAPR